MRAGCGQDGCNGSDWNRNEDIGLIENPEWKRGLQMEEKLHTELLRFTSKETTFEGFKVWLYEREYLLL